MTFDWYRIFNLEEFEDTGLVSREYTVDLAGIGETTVLVTKGNEIGVLFDDVFMILQLNAQNPVVMDGRALYLDSNGDVQVGIEVPDED